MYILYVYIYMYIYTYTYTYTYMNVYIRLQILQDQRENKCPLCRAEVEWGTHAPSMWPDLNTTACQCLFKEHIYIVATVADAVLPLIIMH